MRFPAETVDEGSFKTHAGTAKRESEAPGVAGGELVPVPENKRRGGEPGKPVAVGLGDVVATLNHDIPARPVRCEDPQVIAFRRTVGVEEQDGVAGFVLERFQGVGEGVTLAPIDRVAAFEDGGAGVPGDAGGVVLAVVGHNVQAEAVAGVVAGQDFFDRPSDDLTFVVGGNNDGEKRRVAGGRRRRPWKERADSQHPQPDYPGEKGELHRNQRIYENFQHVHPLSEETDSSFNPAAGHVGEYIPADRHASSRPCVVIATPPLEAKDAGTETGARHTGDGIGNRRLPAIVGQPDTLGTFPATLP